MKKTYILLVAVAMLTGALYAAQISWSVSAVITDADNNTLANARVLLISTDKGAGAPVIGWDGSTATISGGTYLGQTTLNGDGRMIPATIVTMTGTWNAGTINVYGGAAFGQPGTVVATGSGSQNARDYYMVVFDSGTISAGSNLNLASLLNKAVLTETGSLQLIFNANPSQAGWQPIPEPTTWALLGIGALAVGFRRKLFKK